MRTRGREGVKNPDYFAYVLNGSPLTSDRVRSSGRISLPCRQCFHRKTWWQSHLNKFILKRPFGLLPVVAGVVNREAEERPEDLGEHGEDGRDDVGDGELQHEVVHPRHLVRRWPEGRKIDLSRHSSVGFSRRKFDKFNRKLLRKLAFFANDKYLIQYFFCQYHEWYVLFNVPLRWYLSNEYDYFIFMSELCVIRISTLFCKPKKGSDHIGLRASGISK